jgi:hypothetical protein
VGYLQNGKASKYSRDPIQYPITNDISRLGRERIKTMPTLKQKKAFVEVGVNGGIISKAMRDAGYSSSVSKRTDKLVKTKGWQELMNTYLPDSLLGRKHRQLLEKKETIRSYDSEEKRTVVEKTDEIDTTAVTKGLDMAYKLKGLYAPEKHVGITMNIPQEALEKATASIDSFLNARNTKNTKGGNTD